MTTAARNKAVREAGLRLWALLDFKLLYGIFPVAEERLAALRVQPERRGCRTDETRVVHGAAFPAGGRITESTSFRSGVMKLLVNLLCAALAFGLAGHVADAATIYVDAAAGPGGSRRRRSTG